METDDRYLDDVKAIQLYAQNVDVICGRIIMYVTEGDPNNNIDMTMDRLFSYIDRLTNLKEVMIED